MRALLLLVLAASIHAETIGGLQRFPPGELPLTLKPEKESRSLFVEALASGDVSEPCVLAAGAAKAELVPGHRGWYRFDLPPFTEVTLARASGKGAITLSEIAVLNTGLPEGVVDKAVEQVTVDSLSGDQATLRNDVCGGGKWPVPARWIATRAPALLPAVVPSSRGLVVRRGLRGLYEKVQVAGRTSSDEWMDGPALTIVLRDCPMDNVVERVVDGPRAAYLSTDGRVRFVGPGGVQELCSTEELAHREGAHAARVIRAVGDARWVDAVAAAFLKRAPARPLAAGDRLAVDLVTRREDHGDDPALDVKAKSGGGYTLAGPGGQMHLPSGLAPAGIQVGGQVELRRLLRPIR